MLTFGIAGVGQSNAVFARKLWLNQQRLDRRIAGLVLCAFLMWGTPIWAAPVTFSKPVTISRDTDVLTTGSLVYAFNLGGSEQTINNVVFAAAKADQGAAPPPTGNLTIVSGGDGTSIVAVDTPTFVGDGEPYNSLTAAYKSLLGSAYYNTSTKGTLVVRLSGLKVGASYSVQFFVNDSRGTNRADTVSSGGHTSETVSFNNPVAPGGVGEFLTASFTADSESQEFVFAPVVGVDNGDAQLNALQLRMTSPSNN